MIVSKNDSISAQNSKRSDVLNDVLYNMVKKYPDHKSAESVYAKVQIIGRTYSAALERGANHDKETEGDIYWEKIIPALLESGLDELLEINKKVKKITKYNLESILKTHKKLVDILQAVTGKENRSFASKYLHFHCKNAFYIFDSRAKERINQINIMYDYLLDESSIEPDKEYANFCLKCMALQDQIFEEYDVFLTPRQIDNLLLQKKSLQ